MRFLKKIIAVIGYTIYTAITFISIICFWYALVLRVTSYVLDPSFYLNINWNIFYLPFIYVVIKNIFLVILHKNKWFMTKCKAKSFKTIVVIDIVTGVVTVLLSCFFTIYGILGDYLYLSVCLPISVVVFAIFDGTIILFWRNYSKSLFGYKDVDRKKEICTVVVYSINIALVIMSQLHLFLYGLPHRIIWHIVFLSILLAVNIICLFVCALKRLLTLKKYLILLIVDAVLVLPFSVISIVWLPDMVILCLIIALLSVSGSLIGLITTLISNKLLKDS